MGRVGRVGQVGRVANVGRVGAGWGPDTTYISKGAALRPMHLTPLAYPPHPPHEPYPPYFLASGISVTIVWRSAGKYLRMAAWMFSWLSDSVRSMRCGIRRASWPSTCIASSDPCQ